MFIVAGLGFGFVLVGGILMLLPGANKGRVDTAKVIVLVGILLLISWLIGPYLFDWAQDFLGNTLGFE